MLNFLYTLFIAPIEFWMEKALDWGFEHTQSWGWAIIVMSLVVNTVILPIYLKAEHWQEEERAIRKSFEKDEAMIKRTFKGQERFAMLTTMHRLAGYSPLLTLRSSIGFFLQIPFFIAAYHFLSHFDPLQGVSFMGLADLSKPDEMFNLGGFAINFMPILMTIINIGSALIYTQNLSKRDKYQLYGMAAIFLVLLYNAASGLVLYWTFNNIYSLGKNFVLHDAQKLFSGISLPKFNLRNSVQKVSQKSKFAFNNIPFESVQNLFWPASLLWLSITFIYFPIELYNSDPEAFSIPVSEVFASLLGTCQIFIFALFLIWFFSRGRIRTIVSYITVSCVLTSLVYAFVWQPDVGAMDAFILQKPQALKNPLNKYFDIGVLIVCLILTVALIQWKLIKQTRIIASLSIVAVLSLSVFNVFSLSAKTTSSDMQISDDQMPDSTKKMFTFSKNGKNVIVLMLDAFTGGNLKQVLEKHPDLTDELDGFTWYPDSISSGSVTIFGLPGILGGEEVAAYNLTDKKRTESLETTINKSWARFLNSLIKKGFYPSIFDYNWLDKDLISQYLEGNSNLIQSPTLWENLPNIWAARNKLEYKKNLVKMPDFFMVYGLYKMGARSKQNQLYNNGKWRSSISNNFAQMRSLHWYSQLDSFFELSSVDPDAQSQFKFIINQTTHEPWNLDQNCIPISGTIKKQQNDDGTYTPHLKAEFCAMKAVIKWLNWMKQSQVYKNTLFVIVSDHGDRDSSQIFKMWDGKPPYTRMHSLLLVKPFNASGPLRTDYSPITNYDVPTIVFNELGEKMKKPWCSQDRLRQSVIHKSWIRSKQAENYLLAQRKINIKGNMFIKENWQIEKFKP